MARTSFRPSCATSRASSSALSRSTRRSRSIPLTWRPTDFGDAFNNPGLGTTYADQFIQTNKPDVVFQVAGKTGNGILQSACAAGLYGIGVDVDQYLSLNAATDPTYGCIVTSAEKHLSASVSAVIQQIYLGQSSADLGLDQFGSLHFNATNDGIGVSPDHEATPDHD